MLLFVYTFLKGVILTKNENLLLENNNESAFLRRIPLQNKQIKFTLNEKEIGLNEIGKILRYIISAKKKYNLSIFPLTINLGECIFTDKLSYVILENISHFLIDNCNTKLTLNFKCAHNIFNEGIKNSFLPKINSKDKEKKFLKKHSIDISRSHFRRIIEKDNIDIATTSRVVQDIDNFLKFFSIQDEYRDAVSNVVGELLDNALDHSNSDCLIDLDVTNDYIKRGAPSTEEYYGVNIVILNFSETLLGDKLSNKLKSKRLEDLPQRYLQLKEAYDFHSKHFNNCYDEQSFFSVASFQHKISCRDSLTGGTGLTQLIRTLEEKSDAYNCYVLSGFKKVNFLKKLLSYDEDEWIGFNSSKNFLSDIPDIQVVENAPFFFPGTAYNLNFVLKRGKVQ